MWVEPTETGPAPFGAWLREADMRLKTFGLAAVVVAGLMILSILCPMKNTPMARFQTGSVVVAERSVPIRQSPPKEGLFYSGKGRALGHAQAGDTFRVTDVATVRKPMGDEIWLHVERMGGMGGWVYAGRPDSDGGNFSVNQVASK